jgi:hypothetical protein
MSCLDFGMIQAVPVQCAPRNETSEGLVGSKTTTSANDEQLVEHSVRELHDRRDQEEIEVHLPQERREITQNSPYRSIFCAYVNTFALHI